MDKTSLRKKDIGQNEAYNLILSKYFTSPIKDHLFNLPFELIFPSS